MGFGVTSLSYSETNTISEVQGTVLKNEFLKRGLRFSSSGKWLFPSEGNDAARQNMLREAATIMNNLPEIVEDVVLPKGCVILRIRSQVGVPRTIRYPQYLEWDAKAIYYDKSFNPSPNTAVPNPLPITDNDMKDPLGRFLKEAYYPAIQQPEAHHHLPLPVEEIIPAVHRDDRPFFTRNQVSRMLDDLRVRMDNHLLMAIEEMMEDMADDLANAGF